MMFWNGIDVQTRDDVILHDSPLRVEIRSLRTGRRYLFQATAVQHLTVVTSMALGTAAIVVVDNLLIEAAPQSDVNAGRFHAALNAARQFMEQEIDFERVWAEESVTTDELLQRIIREGLGGTFP